MATSAVDVAATDGDRDRRRPRVVEFEHEARQGSVGAGRSTLTVLFSDLVASTQLRCRLGEEAAEEVRRRHDRLVVEAIEANRGWVIKHLGDGVMATFTGAGDATAAAVRLQQALDRQNRSGSSRVSLEVRVGLSAGDVLVEEGDCFGTPVIEAARLCGAARGGQILVTEVVRVLAGSGCAYHFAPAGSFDLKGLPGPVPACEVVWEPAPVSTVPMPALLTDPGRVFVGREAEMERLCQLWKEAAAGEPRVMLVSGEPGVGKTRLAAEFVAEVHEEGATVLAGRCDEDLGVPFQPFVEALRHFVDHTPAETLPASLGRYGGELVRLVPELGERVPGLPPLLRSDPETERYRLFDAVASWVAAVSVDAPLVLVLDDLQWAAKPTLLLLRHLVRAPDLERVFVVGTYRDTELGHGHPLLELLADLRRQAGVERLSLSGLDEGGVIAFIEQVAGKVLDEEDLDLVHAVYQETEGNPFFVREVLRHLTETGALERRQGHLMSRVPVEELGIPAGVREVVGRRLSRLSGEANRALRLAAVVGTEFELPVVQAAIGLDEDVLLQALEEAMGAQLVQEISSAAPRYRFSHVLVRDTLYEDLSAGRRVTYHRRVAAAIEAVHGGRTDDHLPALAYHWARASAPAADTARAVDYATRAGDRALAQLAHDEAVVYYRQALDLLMAADVVDRHRRLELLIALGEAQRRAGDPIHRETLLEAAHLAQEHGDAHALARACLANHRGWFASAGFVDSERVAMLKAALASDVIDDATRARLLAILAGELVYSDEADRRFGLSDEAVAIARRLGDPAVLAFVLVSRCTTLWNPATLSERLDAAADVLNVTENVEDPVARFFAYRSGYNATMQAGDIKAADGHLEGCLRLAEEIAQPAVRWMATYIRASRSLMRGELDECERLASATLEIGEAAGQPDARLFFAVQLFGVRFEQGRLTEVEDTVADLAKIPLPVARAIIGLIRYEQGHIDEARAVLDGLAAAEFTDLPFENSWLTAMALISQLCVALDDRPRAILASTLLAPYEDQVVAHTLVWSGSVAHHLAALAATLERFDEADRRFAAAEAMHERLGAPIWLARTRLAWARMLLTRCQPGDDERARKLLDQALATAREFGLRSIEQQAAALARSVASLTLK